MIKKERFISLDVLRGLTVVGMILVNNQGQGKSFTTLQHSSWNGCSAADFVYPFFLFIVGAAIFFTFMKNNFEINTNISLKILRRGFLIFLIGVILNVFMFDPRPEHWRIMGVLQRIAIVYVCSSYIVLWLKSFKRILSVAIIILLGYWGVLLVTGYTLEDNIVTIVDRFLFGENHLYSGYGVYFDPEGVVSSIPSIANALFGFLAAKLLTMERNKNKVPYRTALCGIAMIGVSLAWNLIFPFNKPMWTSSFVLYTSGWAVLIWFLFYWIIDIKKIKGWTPFFLVFGTNALFTYILSDVLAIMNWKFPFREGEVIYYFSTWLDKYVYGVLTQTPIRSLLWGITMVFICWVVTYPLYKRKIFIKI